MNKSNNVLSICRKWAMIVMMCIVTCYVQAQPYSKNKFAWGTTTRDTAWTNGQLMVDSGVRVKGLRTSDSNKVIGVDANGQFTLRTKSNAASVDSSIYSTVSRLRDTATAIRSSIVSSDTVSLSNRIDSKVSYTDSNSVYATPKTLRDSLNLETLNRVARRGNFLDTQAFIRLLWSGVPTGRSFVVMDSNRAYGVTSYFSSSTTPWRLRTAGPGAGTQSVLDLGYRIDNSTIAYSSIYPTVLTGNRNHYLQDKDGTLAYLSDISDSVQNMRRQGDTTRMNVGGNTKTGTIRYGSNSASALTTIVSGRVRDSIAVANGKRFIYTSENSSSGNTNSVLITDSVQASGTNAHATFEIAYPSGITQGASISALRITNAGATQMTISSGGIINSGSGASFGGTLNAAGYNGTNGNSLFTSNSTTYRVPLTCQQYQTNMAMQKWTFGASTTLDSVQSNGVFWITGLAGYASTNPTLVARNGAGTGATTAIDSRSNNLNMLITINVGTSPGTNDTLIRVNLPSSRTRIPLAPILTPANSNAANEIAKVWIEPDWSTTGAVFIRVGAAALTASTTYKYYLLITE